MTNGDPNFCTAFFIGLVWRSGWGFLRCNILHKCWLTLLLPFYHRIWTEERKLFQSNYIPLWETNLESVDPTPAVLETSPSILVKLLGWIFFVLIVSSLKSIQCSLRVWWSCSRNYLQSSGHILLGLWSWVTHPFFGPRGHYWHNDRWNQEPSMTLLSCWPAPTRSQLSVPGHVWGKYRIFGRQI